MVDKSYTQATNPNISTCYPVSYTPDKIHYVNLPHQALSAPTLSPAHSHMIHSASMSGRSGAVMMGRSFGLLDDCLFCLGVREGVPLSTPTAAVLYEYRTLHTNFLYFKMVF